IRRSDALPFRLQRVGCWWDPRDEIDLVGLNEAENAILFGEVKWSPKPLGTNILQALKAGPPASSGVGRGVRRRLPSSAGKASRPSCERWPGRNGRFSSSAIGRSSSVS
ncbi:MAG: hypothetical protein HYY19_03540, partial [Candidatus Rokubacteria bacterium]|nr:hypothetical protein [Candidatus Rokubacteria bacterium]